MTSTQITAQQSQIEEEKISKILALLTPLPNDHRSRILKAAIAFYGFKLPIVESAEC